MFLDSHSLPLYSKAPNPSDAKLFDGFNLYLSHYMNYRFRDVPPSSTILEGYRKLTPSGPRELTEEMQLILAEADKPKKGGKGAKKGGKKTTDKDGSSTTVKPPTKK